MKETKFDRFSTGLVRITERYLTWRKRRKHIKSEKHKQRNVIIDWLDAFLWAAGVVLLINQYLFQAYQIPTPSMENTILVSDRIFVNKFIYGPELLPGLFKIDGFKEPERTEIVIFENPSYISKGTGFDVLQRILYMITLTLVDIDKDENGNPRAHFLIKRAVGDEGDQLRFEEGELMIRPEGESEWMSESVFKEISGYEYETQRKIFPETYPILHDAARAAVYQNIGIEVSEEMARNATSFSQYSYMDAYEYSRTYSVVSYTAAPHTRNYAERYFRYREGQYLPQGWVLPLGDNRDNSNDGRYFGPIMKDELLGRASFTYWPLHRIGLLR